jgi:hypothetical protein
MIRPKKLRLACYFLGATTAVLLIQHQLRVRQRAEIHTLLRQAVLDMVLNLGRGRSYLHSINDQDWISYHSRSLAFGEHAALQWLVGKGAQP